jgi:hypothetical protein
MSRPARTPRRGLGPAPERCQRCGGLHVVLLPHAGRRYCLACFHQAKREAR